MIEYTSAHPSHREVSRLEGFFEGWQDPPGPHLLFRILGSSDVSIVARDSEEEDRLVGFVAAITDSTLSAHITLLEVLPDHRGRGIGTELARRAVAALDRVYAIDVVCDPELEGFYERLGFSRLSGMALRRSDRIEGVRAEPYGFVEVVSGDSAAFEILEQDPDQEEAEEEGIPPWIQPMRGSPISPVLTSPAVLHQDDGLVVWISGIEVADEGFSVTLSARATSEDANLLDAFGWAHGPEGYSRFDHERFHSIVRTDLPDDFFRFGIRFADGTEVSNVDADHGDWKERPAGPVMSSGGGGGGGNDYDAGFRIWPLPPEGRTVAWCEWPAGGVPRSEAELDTAAILRAAEPASSS